MESDNKRVATDELLVDRISALPDCLIDHILGFVMYDFGVVVRTSVLSKRWRFCWTRVKRLYFETKCLDKYAKGRGVDDMVAIIDSFLSRHDGSLDQFKLHVHTRDRESEGFDVCRWMKVLSEKKIREIEFHIIPTCVSSPFSIFNCSSLTRLSLQCCDFGPSSDFLGSTNLVSLYLNHIKITSGLLESVISNSPLLRDLSLMDVEMEENVVIDSPGLQSLMLGSCIHMDELFCLKEYPNLTSGYFGLKLEVPLTGHGRTCKLDKFAKSMPNIESLTLCAESLIDLAVGSIPLKLSTPLENLKNLDFYDLDILSPSHLSCFFCLIRSAPNLQDLDISVYEPYGANRDWITAVYFYIAQEEVGFLSHVSKLRVANMLGLDWEVVFITSLVSCCPKLETLLFSSHEDIESDLEDSLFLKLSELQCPEGAVMKFRSGY